MTRKGELSRIEELSAYLYINSTNTQVTEFYDVYDELCELLVGNSEDYTGDIATIDREMTITRTDGSRWKPEGDWKAFHEYIGLIDDKIFKNAFSEHLDEHYSPGNYPIKDVLIGPKPVPKPKPYKEPEPIDWDKLYFSKKNEQAGEVISFEQANKMWSVMSAERSSAMGFGQLYPVSGELIFKSESYFVEDEALWKQYCHEKGI